MWQVTSYSSHNFTNKFKNFQDRPDVFPQLSLGACQRLGIADCSNSDAVLYKMPNISKLTSSQ